MSKKADPTQIALSLKDAATVLGISMTTLLYIIERGDLRVERGQDGKIDGVHLDK